MFPSGKRRIRGQRGNGGKHLSPTTSVMLWFLIPWLVGTQSALEWYGSPGGCGEAPRELHNLTAVRFPACELPESRCRLESVNRPSHACHASTAPPGPANCSTGLGWVRWPYSTSVMFWRKSAQLGCQNNSPADVDCKKIYTVIKLKLENAPDQTLLKLKSK